MIFRRRKPNTAEIRKLLRSVYRAGRLMGIAEERLRLVQQGTLDPVSAQAALDQLEVATREIGA